MKLSHPRQFLRLAAGAAALLAISHMAMAETYPSRPARIILGVVPGGVSDIYARLMTVAPVQSGYGLSLIRDLVPHELGGTVDLTSPPSGVCCKIEIPLGRT
jgi:tripartite-type tricarboxylate transporter receptor subunit TctC